MKTLHCYQKWRPLITLKRNLSIGKNSHKGSHDYDPSEYIRDMKPDNILVKEYREKLQKRDPIERCKNILKNDMKFLGQKIKSFAGFEPRTYDEQAQFFPTHCDVLIIGGGATGSSISYWLKQRAPNAMSIVVVEKETKNDAIFTYSTMGGLTQQYALPENIQMSIFNSEFLRTLHKTLKIDGKSAPDPQFHPCGYLHLANESTATTLKENSELQNKLGARNILLTPEKLKEKFPWINTNGIELACLGLENEGWYNPVSVINALKQKSINLGVEYIQADVIGYDFQYQPLITVPSKTGHYEQIDKAILKLPNGELQSIKFGYCIIAAGAESGRLTEMAGIGTRDGLLSVPLPIEPRRRHVFYVQCPGGPGLDTPVVLDPSGVYFRREGLSDMYVAGLNPSLQEELTKDNSDNKVFENEFRTLLRNRVPAFKNLEIKNKMAGVYEYNTLDDCGVLGLHPYYHNLIIASGFNGHGIQYAPAVGRAIMELLLDGEFKTIDLSRLGFDRICLGERLLEQTCV